MKIMIVKIPEGEAPFWVREQWLWLELPLLEIPNNPGRYFCEGVISGKNPLIRLWNQIGNFFGLGLIYDGYVVETTAAVNVLRSKSPAAAKWWIENCRLLDNQDHLIVFRREECVLVMPDFANSYDA